VTEKSPLANAALLLIDFINDLEFEGGERVLPQEVCVLFTANDAYLRNFELFVPEDCVASLDEERKQNALRYMREVLKANTAASDKPDSCLAVSVAA
jgi:nicotinamidase-related amidase